MTENASFEKLMGSSGMGYVPTRNRISIHLKDKI
jgi:hypothetical protein